MSDRPTRMDFQPTPQQAYEAQREQARDAEVSRLRTALAAAEAERDELRQEAARQHQRADDWADFSLRHPEILPPAVQAEWFAIRCRAEAAETRAKDAERFREALEDIVDMDCGDICGARARRALSSSPGETAGAGYPSGGKAAE